MFVCTKCHRARRMKREHWPIRCCGVLHEWPAGSLGSVQAINKPPAKALDRSIDCMHKGAMRRITKCLPCGGGVSIKVFECALHGECTPKKPMGIPCCQSCGDYQRPAYSLSDITICVTSFLRFECLRRFITSARFFYPGMPIVVADQSGDKARGPDYDFCRNAPNVTWLAMGFDAGISVSRNAAVAAAKTKLICLLDDDHVFTDESRLETLLDVLNSDTSLSLVCGVLRMDNKIGNYGRTAAGWFADFSIDGDMLKHSPPSKPWKRTPAGVSYRPLDRYINCFLAPKKALQAVPWHSSHKIAHEHLDHCLAFWQAGYKAAYTPNCIFGEIGQESAEYAKFRKRRSRPQVLTRLGLKDQTGSQRMATEHGISDRQTQAPTAEPPCIVLLTVGHTGSTVVAGLFQALGWHLPDNDPQYNEPLRVRAINDRRNAGETPPNPESVAETLRSFPRPWLLKDPRFCERLDDWLPLFATYKPLLLWLTREPEAVRESYRRRGESLTWLEKRFVAAQRHWDYWPWARQQITYEDIASWASGWR